MFSRFIFALSLGALVASGAPMASRRYVDRHIANTNNPHRVTAEQVGAVPVTGYDARGRFWLSARASGREVYFGDDGIWQATKILDREYCALLTDGVVDISDLGATPADRWRRVVYGPYSLSVGDQRSGGQRVEMELLLPAVRAGTERLAVVSDVDRRKDLHWDESAGVLWRTDYVNGYLVVTAVTNTPVAD